MLAHTPGTSLALPSTSPVHLPVHGHTQCPSHCRPTSHNHLTAVHTCSRCGNGSALTAAQSPALILIRWCPLQCLLRKQLLVTVSAA
jgi:hypothetical protein